MLAKLVVLVGLVVLVWKAYQWGALAQRRKMAGGAPAARAPGATSAPRAREPAAEDLHACAICGAYVARGSTPCGKPECPQRR
ncbi:hypothetical protein [Nitrospirillum pindoramense]|uniref:Uncharacterized protein n=1 Tax=Nitrospirillum amazonense TaxID=28077 RepID=A0A560GY74_9PROT|nr:hypothetical protein [Nitrospirillum amazonense]TWB38539.1 hypothetical protein FBZ90_11227 [Nitrospirillum amazonense]